MNKITIKNHYTLPFINKTLNWLIEIRWFIKFNLKDVYHQLHIRHSNEWKMIFHIQYDHFEYMIMSFGLFNMPATFQAYINKVLTDIIDVFCVVYLDDILIYSNLLKKHWDHVK